MLMALRPEIEAFAESVCNYIMVERQDLSMALYYADQYLPSDFTVTDDELRFIYEYIITNTTYSIKEDTKNAVYSALGYRLQSNVETVQNASASMSGKLLFLGGLVLISFLFIEKKGK